MIIMLMVMGNVIMTKVIIMLVMAFTMTVMVNDDN